MFIVMSIATEGSDNMGHTVCLKDDKIGLIGILPVYETREQAEAEHPNSVICEANFVTA